MINSLFNRLLTEYLNKEIISPAFNEWVNESNKEEDISITKMENYLENEIKQHPMDVAELAEKINNYKEEKFVDYSF